MRDFERLKGSVQKDIDQIKKAERERPSLLSYTTYLGTLGLLIVLPVLLGAYLGVWLDSRFGTFFWTAVLIVAGVIIGGITVYLYLRE